MNKVSPIGMTISKVKRERKTRNSPEEEENLKGQGNTSSVIHCFRKYGNTGEKRGREIVSHPKALNLLRLSEL